MTHTKDSLRRMGIARCVSDPVQDLCDSAIGRDRATFVDTLRERRVTNLLVPSLVLIRFIGIHMGCAASKRSDIGSSQIASVEKRFKGMRRLSDVTTHFGYFCNTAMLKDASSCILS